MDYDKLEKEWKEYLNSPQFEKDIKEYAQKLNTEDEIKVGRIEKVDRYLSSVNFDTLMNRLKTEHNEEYKDRCYKNGYMPHPNNKLCLLLDFLNEKISEQKDFIDGVTVDGMPGQTVHFYRGYYFVNVSFHTGFTRILTEEKTSFFQI